MTKEIMLSRDGLLVKRNNDGISVEYNGNLSLTVTGSINLTVKGELNILGNAPINIDAPKTDDTNYPITLNSRLNSNIKDLSSSISFRKKSEEKTRKALERVNTELSKEELTIDKILEINEKNEFELVKNKEGK